PGNYVAGLHATCVQPGCDASHLCSQRGKGPLRAVFEESKDLVRRLGRAMIADVAQHAIFPQILQIASHALGRFHSTPSRLHTCYIASKNNASELATKVASWRCEPTAAIRAMQYGRGGDLSIKAT